MQVYNDELYHFGILGMKWGKRKSKPIDFYNKELNKNQKSNSLERSKLRTQYDKGRISYDNYIKQDTQLIRTHTQKALTNAKKSVLSNMTDKERKILKKNTTIGKKQVDILLDKIARGGEMTLMDKVSLYGYK